MSRRYDSRVRATWDARRRRLMDRSNYRTLQNVNHQQLPLERHEAERVPMLGADDMPYNPRNRETRMERRRRLLMERRRAVQNVDYQSPLERAEAERLPLLAIDELPVQPEPLGDYYLRIGDPCRGPIPAERIDLSEYRIIYIVAEDNGKCPKTENETYVGERKRKSQERKSPAKKICKRIIKFKIREFDFSMPYHCIPVKEAEYVLSRINKLKSLSSENLQGSIHLPWDIMKISSIFQFNSMPAIMDQDGLYTVPLKISNHLRFLQSLNVSHSQEVNDVNLQALPDYCKYINHINLDDCLNLSTTGIQIVRSLLEFKGCYVDSVIRPRIFDAKVLSQFSPIDILDRDSLYIIFKMLPLCERLKLSDVCISWKNMTDDFWKRLTTLDSSTCQKKINLETFIEIIKKSQKSLRHIDFNLLLFCVYKTKLNKSLLMEIFIYMKKYIFKNLFTLNLSGISLTDKLLDIFIGQKNYPKLKKLTVGAHNCVNNDVIKKVLGKVNNLVYLELIENSSITGNMLINQFKFLETLKLNNCSQVTEHLERAIQSMPHLRNLSITNCKRFIDPLVKIGSPTLKFLQLSYNIPLVTIEKCDILEVLDLSHSYVDDKYLMSVREKCPNVVRINISFCKLVTDIGLKSITSLPKIEHLSMNCLSRVSDKFLTIYTLKTLECRNCIELYNAGVINLLSAASSLELLDLTNCQYITQHLVEYAIKKTKKRTNGITLKMYIGGTNVQMNQIMDESPRLHLVDVPEPRYPKKKVEPDQDYYYASIDQFDED